MGSNNRTCEAGGRGWIKTQRYYRPAAAINRNWRSPAPGRSLPYPYGKEGEGWKCPDGKVAPARHKIQPAGAIVAQQSE